jgi:hypothetical protein
LIVYSIFLANQVADCFFYDVGALDWSEWRMLHPLVDRKGTIIAVSPRSAQRQDRIRRYTSTLSFMQEEGDSVQAIAVAGGGSSTLGTASLARNIADCTGWEVAGIVTGYGMADLILESLGGWFFFGWVDRIRYEMELAIDRVLAPPSPPVSEAPGPFTRCGSGNGRNLFNVLGDSDVLAVHDILLAGPPNLRLLAGHSKGNLLISFVLSHMNEDRAARVRSLRNSRHPLFDHLAVVTLGAVVDLPTEAFGLETHQYIGQLDWLGQMNSLRYPPIVGTIAADHEMIPGAGHHLNPAIPCAMSVADVLRRAGLG